MKHVRYEIETGRIVGVVNTSHPDVYVTDTHSLVLYPSEIEDDTLELYEVLLGEVVPRVVPADEAIAKVRRHIRVVRRTLLAGSDWTQIPDAPFDAVKRREWRDYRQALRDLPNTYQNETDPANIVWPKAPE